MNSRILVVNHSPKSVIAEAFRAFRTKILHPKEDSVIKSILFTSAGAGEGKSVMVANTAVALAQTGKKVIIMDCDLRKPVQHEIFHKRKPHLGLTNFLSGECLLANIVQETGIPNLRVIISGPIPQNPAELLDSDKTREIISTLKSQADYIIVDSPPVLPVTDACILGPLVDGVILVVGVGRVQPEMALKAKEHLEAVKGNILGQIVNRSDTYAEQSAYYRYYGNVEKAAN